MLLTYKFRAYPSRQQEEKLEWTLDKCRFVYNKLLEFLEKEPEIKRFELQHKIVELRKETPELKKVYARTLQYEHYKLFANLAGLSKARKNGNRVGRLRFKGARWFKTFSYNQQGFRVSSDKKRVKLTLSKIGEITLKRHRKIEGRIKQVTMKKSRSGKWFALIIADAPQETISGNKKKIGIDLGLNSYAYDSDGNRFEHPKNFDKSLKRVVKAQRKLSRKKKESRNRVKMRIRLAKIHEKIENQRNDFLHKLSSYYVKNYGVIAIEELGLRELIKKSRNPRKILDASWHRFSYMLEYKAESAGVQVIRVDPKGTTQTCSNCGKIARKKLWDRLHKCQCGLEIDRDFNSAKEILKRALRQELPEFTPAETEPLLERASLVKEAGNSG